MITAVDTSVLLDVLGADATFGQRSHDALLRATAEGRLVASDVVWAEIAVFFTSANEATNILDRVGVSFDPLNAESAIQAGTAWRSYRDRGGKRDRVVSDFLIGAHALVQAERLLTRDRGFYRSYFSKLRLLDPSAR